MIVGKNQQGKCVEIKYCFLRFGCGILDLCMNEDAFSKPFIATEMIPPFLDDVARRELLEEPGGGL